MVSNRPGERGYACIQEKSLRKEREQKPQVDRACSVLDVPCWTMEPSGEAD